MRFNLLSSQEKKDDKIKSNWSIWRILILSLLILLFTKECKKQDMPESAPDVQPQPTSPEPIPVPPTPAPIISPPSSPPSPSSPPPERTTLTAPVPDAQEMAATISFLENKVVVLEYNSVYDVHPLPDINYASNIRLQPADFDMDVILKDLEKVVVPGKYDFVLLYSLHELPGWVNAGIRYSYPAKNIGFWNNFYGTSLRPARWDRLKAAPHMNYVGLDDYPVLSAIHEMGHQWGVFIIGDQNVGPREWKRSDPIAWLAGGGAHWSWVWKWEGMPGMMYSGPLGRFNAFDLYLMGLMGYKEASRITYIIYENDHPGRTHRLVLDDLIYSLSLMGPDYYEGNGRRIPDTDESMKHLQILIVIVKGRDEVLSRRDESLIKMIAENIPAAWKSATWGRSAMDTVVERR